MRKLSLIMRSNHVSLAYNIGYWITCPSETRIKLNKTWLLFRIKLNKSVVVFIFLWFFVQLIRSIIIIIRTNNCHSMYTSIKWLTFIKNPLHSNKIYSFYFCRLIISTLKMFWFSIFFVQFFGLNMDSKKKEIILNTPKINISQIEFSLSLYLRLSLKFNRKYSIKLPLSIYTISYTLIIYYQRTNKFFFFNFCLTSNLQPPSKIKSTKNRWIQLYLIFNICSLKLYLSHRFSLLNNNNNYLLWNFTENWSRPNKCRYPNENDIHSIRFFIFFFLRSFVYMVLLSLFWK